MSKLLLDEKPLQVLPSLACAIGLNEAIFLQQLHYWLKDSKHIHDGRQWVFNSYEGWREQFKFWSISTIRRTIKSCIDQGLVIDGSYNKLKQDNTKWYTINYDNVELVSSDKPLVQNEQTNCSKWTNPLVQNEQTVTREYTETTTEISISNDILSTAPKISESAPYEDIVSEYHKNCPSLPKVKFLSTKRRANIRTRWKTYNDLSVFVEVFKKAEASDFLSGRNGKWTSCNFDWLINETNMIKVLEGNYDNKGGEMSGTAPRPPSTGYGQSPHKSEYAGYISSG